MKNKLIIIPVILLAVSVFGSCKKSGSSLEGENLDKDASYALGMNIGTVMATDKLFPNMDEFVKGMMDVITGKETRLNEMEARTAIENAFTALMESRDSEAREKETAFLEENGKKPGIIVTPSGLQYEVITEGNGAKPAASDMVRVHYHGTFTNGDVFDSSVDRGTPAEFHLGGVIPGWTEGLQLMSVGSKYKFYIPSEIGYGPNGWGSIPPYSTLIFEIELLDILDVF
jgi:FKBP-type peptidyl-prolyl cis-trans isomerase